MEVGNKEATTAVPTSTPHPLQLFKASDRMQVTPEIVT